MRLYSLEAENKNLQSENSTLKYILQMLFGRIDKLELSIDSDLVKAVNSISIYLHKKNISLTNENNISDDEILNSKEENIKEVDNIDNEERTVLRVEFIKQLLTNTVFFKDSMGNKQHDYEYLLSCADEMALLELKKRNNNDSET